MRQLRNATTISLCVLCARGVISAQFQMPDARQMSGIPRPVDDLPAGSISIRLVRGSLSNNITNHPVQLRVGDRVLTVKTDDAGRAQFDKIEPGAVVKASADVDGEHLESSEFQAPSTGGIRMLLVSTEKAQAPAATPEAAPVSGQVVLGGQSRIVIEPGDEVVTLYYLLDISSTARVPVNPPGVFMFDVPREAIGTTIMQGSTDKASVTGGRVRVQGPFPPGHTVLQVACELPAGRGTIDITQKFPATLEQLALIVKKAGDTVVRSPQISRQQEFPASGEVYIASTGGAVPAGQPISIEVSGLPHHSGAPRSIALALALGIVVIGAGWASRPGAAASDAVSTERKKLLSRRDRQLNEIVRLEQDWRGGRVNEDRYSLRREQLMAALEQVYAALDDHDAAGPDPAAHGRLGAPIGALRAS